MRPPIRLGSGSLPLAMLAMEEAAAACRGAEGEEAGQAAFGFLNLAHKEVAELVERRLEEAKRHPDFSFDAIHTFYEELVTWLTHTHKLAHGEGGGAPNTGNLLVKANILEEKLMACSLLEEKRLEDDSGPAAFAPARHSRDFRSAHWHGTDYSFTATQAAIVKLLWEAMKDGTPDVGSDTLLEAVDARSSRLVDIFRDSPAWSTLIVDGATKGSKRLADPPKS